MGPVGRFTENVASMAVKSEGGSSSSLGQEMDYIFPCTLCGVEEGREVMITEHMRTSHHCSEWGTCQADPSLLYFPHCTVWEQIEALIG